MKRSTISSFLYVAALAAALVAVSCDGDSCECESRDDNYCIDNCTLADCDGCRFEEVVCCLGPDSATVRCTEDGLPNCDEHAFDPDCFFETDSYCSDETHLVSCNLDGDYGVWEWIDCNDPVQCPGGSGCTEGAPFAHCWCHEEEPADDAGVDGGADGGV